MLHILFCQKTQYNCVRLGLLLSTVAEKTRIKNFGGNNKFLSGGEGICRDYSFCANSVLCSGAEFQQEYYFAESLLFLEVHATSQTWCNLVMQSPGVYSAIDCIYFILIKTNESCVHINGRTNP